jgi:hypothetical protein
MNDLRTAAQQAMEALEESLYATTDKSQFLAFEAITALKAALAEPVQEGCDHCNQPLYAAVKCRVCGRVTSQQ